MGANGIIGSLPGMEKCRKIFQSVATLDALLSPQWEYRYYSFNANWDTDEMMASMRDGQGSDFFALFTSQGLIIKGFDQSIGKKSTLDVYSNVPEVFTTFLNEPAFTVDLVTFCIWNTKTERNWESSIVYLATELDLLKVLTFGPEGYRRWARNYFEMDIPLIYINKIFEFEPLDQDLIRSINPNTDLNEIIDDIKEIGYPISMG